MPPSQARAELDAQIASLQDSARTFLEDLPDGMPLGDFLEMMQRPNVPIERVSRATAQMLNVGELVLTIDRRVRLSKLRPANRVSAAYLYGYRRGFEDGRGGVA